MRPSLASLATIGGLWCIGLLAACRETASPSPPPVWSSISAGLHFACGLSNGAAYCWGDNSLGQLGDSVIAQSDTAVAVAGGLKFSKLTAGFSHACGLTSTGAAYCWGTDFYGELGDGSYTPGVPIFHSNPVGVAGGLTFASVVAGGLHTCGLTTTAVAYCWGLNSYGQLGDSTPVVRRTPVPVVGGLTFTDLSAGFNHTCGVTSSGAAYCWGDDEFGQLGDGRTRASCANAFSCSTSPLAVAGGLTFARVTAGYQHSCGLTADGAAYCWGENHSGQLGDGSTDSVTGWMRPTPVAVVGGFTFSELSAGGPTCGVTNVGVAYCWGNNYTGELGDGSTTNRLAAVPVSGGLTLTNVTAGTTHSCGLTARGDGYCWGDNSLGQLGDGSSTQRLSPVAVRNP